MKNLLITLFACMILFCNISYAQDPDCGIEQQFQQLPKVSLTGEISRKIYSRIPAKKWKPKIAAYKRINKCLDSQTRMNFYNLVISQNIDIWIVYSDLEGNYAQKNTLSFNVGNGPKMPLAPESLDLISEVVATKEGRDNLINTYLEVAKITGLTDEALYNLESLKSKIGNDTESLNKIKNVQIEIKNFQKEIQQQEIQPMQERRWDNFEEIIKINQSPDLVTNPRFDDYLEILKDTSVPSGIRDDVIEVFSKVNLPSEIKDEALNYLREQAKNVNSDLFDSALFGLAKFGTTEDKDVVIKGINEPDSIRSIVSINAVGEAGLEKGFNIIKVLALKESDLEKRRAAIDSMEQFSIQQNNPSLSTEARRTLITIAGNAENSFQIKVQAIESVQDIKLPANEAQRLERAQENLFNTRSIMQP